MRLANKTHRRFVLTSSSVENRTCSVSRSFKARTHKSTLSAMNFHPKYQSFSDFEFGQSNVTPQYTNFFLDFSPLEAKIGKVPIYLFSCYIQLPSPTLVRVRKHQPTCLPLQQWYAKYRYCSVWFRQLIVNNNYGQLRSLPANLRCV